ncbi:MAG: hypothetical protein Q9201_004249 [Fulgogasparrea decipioides]
MPSNLVASRDFVQPNLPRHSTNGSKRERSRASSIHSPKSARLSIIEEDGDIPPVPAKAHHRPFHRRWNLGEPPRFSFETPPPKYSVWDVTGPKGEKLSDVRNNKHIARRGGWRRICLIALLVIAVIVGLVVGLAVGLKKKNSNAPNSQDTPLPSTPNTTNLFPAGSYTLTTYLSTIQTDCTSQSQDWSCFPYHTYSESPSQALANFTLIIAAASDNTFTASNNNPLSVAFDPTPLTLLDEGTEDERYHFSTVVDKITPPSLGVQCYFNGTILEGSLYTKKVRNYPPSSSTATSAAAPAATSAASAPDSASRDDFQPWPYAVDIRQSIGGGQIVPQCFKMRSDSENGDRIVDGITPQPANSMCSCDYKNFGS